MISTFYIVRHGQTEWNALEKIQGHSDIELNKNGEAQAVQAAQELKHTKFDIAFSSDLLRARRTAEIIAAEHKVTVATTRLLRERLYGDYEGRHRNELGVFYGKLSELLVHEQEAHKQKAGIESDDKLLGRFLTFLRETAIVHPGKTILVVSHGGMIRLLITHVLGVSDTERKIRIANTGYIVLETDGTDFAVKEMKRITIPEVIALRVR